MMIYFSFQIAYMRIKKLRNFCNIYSNLLHNKMNTKLTQIQLFILKVKNNTNIFQMHIQWAINIFNNFQSILQNRPVYG